MLDDRPAATRTRPARRRVRGDVVAVVLAAALLLAAIRVPYLLSEQQRAELNASAAPLYAWWQPHWSPSSFTSAVLVLLVAAYAPGLAQRLPWRGLLAATWALGLTWSMSVNLVDGWRYGFADRQTDGNEYVPFVSQVTDVGAFLRGFDARILEGVPGSLPTHVSGHPPGATLLFVWIDRIGLGGPVMAGWFCTVVGTLGAVAVVVALRALVDEQTARRAAPFLAFAPAVLWITVSADAVFLGVTAWGVALLALAATGRVRVPWLAAAGAGLLLGFGIYLSYGLVIMGVPAVAVLVVARTWRPLVPAVLAALAVVAAFTLSGFWWLDGYHLVVERYYQGIASERPFSYWGWANLASLLCAVGFATVAGLQRTLRPSQLRVRPGLVALVGSGALMIAVADLSALSKAETERIWLPFAIWLLAACAALPLRHHRFWLFVQGVLPMVIVHLVLTNW
ncbi:hypothetical protein [Rhodococcus aerolatus]